MTRGADGSMPGVDLVDLDRREQEDLRRRVATAQQSAWSHCRGEDPASNWGNRPSSMRRKA